MINGYGSILTTKNLPADQQLQLQPRVAPITQEPKTKVVFSMVLHLRHCVLDVFCTGADEDAGDAHLLGAPCSCFLKSSS